MYTPGQYYGGQASSGGAYSALGPSSPEVRLGHVEATLRELGGRLEAHIADTAKQLAMLRVDTQARAKAAGSAGLFGGTPSGGQASAAGVGKSPVPDGEVFELRARVARLEAEVHGIVHRHAAYSGAGGFFGTSGGVFGGPAANVGWDSEDSGGEFGMFSRSLSNEGDDFASLFGGWFGGSSEPPPAAKKKPSPDHPTGNNSSGRHVPLALTSGAAVSLEHLPADATVLLESSIWDCALIIILHQGCASWKDPRQQWYLGAFNIIETWILLWVNCLVQVLFIIAVHSMSDTTGFVDVQESMMDARLMLGQRFDEIDRKTMTTRAERTCNNQIVDSMATLVTNLAEYLSLNVDKGLIVLPGSTICFLAMLFWVVEMTVELRRCADLFLAVHALPITSRTSIEESGSLHIVKGVTRYHKILGVVFVIIPRALISWYLLVFGKRFLAGTTDITELILNTCALEFIRNVDDMIFEAMATRTLLLFTHTARIFRFDALSQQVLLDDESAEDFQLAGRVSPRIARQRARTGEVFNVLVSIGFVILQSYEGYTSLIKPINEGAQSVYSNVCDGNLRFTWMMHPVADMPLFAQADHNSEELIAMRCFYSAQYEMVRIRAGFRPQHFEFNESLARLVNGTSKLCGKSDGNGPFSQRSCPEMELAELAGLRGMSEIGYFQSPKCDDQDVAFAVIRNTCMSPSFYRGNSVNELKFFEDMHRCSDLAPACTDEKTSRLTFRWYEKLRKVCAQSCKQCQSSEVVASPM